MPETRPQSSSSQHQLHDLGFEDVDLDSPDASGSIKTRSDQAQPVNRRHVMPIPFMQQPSQDKTPSSMLRTEDFDLIDPVGAKSPSNLSEPNTPYPFAPPVQPSSASSVLQESAVHVTMHEDQLQHGSDSYELTQGSSPGHREEASAEAGLLPEVASASAAGPFSTYSGPGSTSSSTPASPRVGVGVPPARRSSFLPRGMSSHLQKALKATAAAASKASAAIAPPPNAPLPPPNWQEGASPQQPALSLPIPKGEQDQEFPFQQAWGPSGPASTGNQDRKENGKPWWQQQLRNLQQNLHTPQQLQSDTASDSNADSAPESNHLLLNGPLQDPAVPVGENGDAAAPGVSSAQPNDQQTSSMPWSPHTAANEQNGLSADSHHRHRQQMDMDSMRIMESLGDGDSISQDQQSNFTAAGDGGLLNRPASEPQRQPDTALLDSRQDTATDDQPEVRSTSVSDTTLFKQPAMQASRRLRL